MVATIIQPTVADVQSITDPVYAYESDNGLFSASFASSIGTDNAVKFTTNGHDFAWRPQNVVYVDSSGNLDVIVGVNASASAQVWKSRVTYLGTSALTTDIFDCQGDQLKHTIRMEAPPRIPASFIGTPTQMASGGVITYDTSLEIWANGQNQTGDFEVTGDIGFKDSSGNLIYKLPMIVATDDAGNATNGTYKVTFNADGTISFYGMVPWNWLQTATYPVLIDPTVIASNSAYEVMNNGQQTLVALSNGWLVQTFYSTNSPSGLYFYVSKDDGSTWSQLTYVTNATSGGGQGRVAALCCSGTTVYALYAGASGNGYFLAFDAATVSNTDHATNAVVAMPGATYNWNYGKNCGIAVDGSGTLYAHAVVPPAGSGAAQNFYYLKSTDGGSTWTTKMLSQWNSSANTGPVLGYIVVLPNNTPVIFGQTGGSDSQTGYKYGDIYCYSSLDTSSIVVNAVSPNAGASGGTHNENPSAVVDKNGVIYCFWDSGYNSSSGQINYATSTDGGVTWSASAYITSGTDAQYAPSATVDKDNKIRVYWYGIDSAVSTSYYNIRNAIYSGSTWGSPSTLTSNTTANANSVYALWAQFNMNSTTDVRYVWYDGQSSSIKFDKIVLDNMPNAPVLNDEATFDATTNATFTWAFSDPDSGDTQSAYQLQIIDSSTNSVVLDTGKVISTTSSYALAANTLTNGKQYQWRVTTWDSSNVQGPWSSYAVFYTSAPPTATITSPTAGATDTDNPINVSFVFSDPASYSQQSFQVQLLDSTDTTVLADSGTVAGAGNKYMIQYNLANDTTYHVKVRVTNDKNMTSAWADHSFTTSFTSSYAATLSATDDSTNAKISIAITNPAYKTTATTPTFTGTGNGTMSQPTTTDGTTTDGDWTVTCTNATAPATFSVDKSGTQVGTATVGTTFSYNGVTFTISSGSTAFAVNDAFAFTTNAIQVSSQDIQRRITGTSTWSTIASNLSNNANYDDYKVSSGISYDYKVTTYGSNGISIDSSSITASVVFSGDWVYNPTSGKQFQFLYNRKSYSMAIQEERKEVQTFGTKPMIRRGPLNARTGTLDALMIQHGTTRTPVQQLQAFESDMSPHNAYYLKTAAGEVFKVDLHNVKRSMPKENLNTQAIGISVDWTEIA